MRVQDRITIESGKRSGQATVRGTRMTGADVLSYLAAGMTAAEPLGDFSDLTEADVHARLAYAGNR